MSFISYAQNFEDVMLWRALKHVEKGCYLDIGAQDPLLDSVSLAFYEHGWRGMHVEPTQQYSDKLRMARLDELVLQVAIGNQSGALTFYEFENTGLSTADPDIAHKHQRKGFRCHETVVPVITLDSLFERIGVQNIHWMKLDVEGMEMAVLESWKGDWVLPWVLVIESTQPMTQEESYEEWEQLVLDKGYKYVYFDGLNRFYVSPSHIDLASAFRSPPNVFDGFVLSGTASQPFYQLFESKAQQAEIKFQQSRAKAEQALATADEYHALLMSVYSSTFWRITKPLRWTLDHLRGLRNIRVQVMLKRLMKVALLALIRLMSVQPKLKHVGVLVAARFGMSGKLRRLYWSSKVMPIGDQYGFSMTQDYRQLSPRARQIYAALKQAIQHRHEEVR